MKIGRIVILAAMILLCIVMGFLNFKGKGEKPELTPSPVVTSSPIPQEEEEKDDLFSSLRLQRRKDREEEIAMLKEILNHENQSGEGAEMVSERIVTITEYYEQEREMEQQLILRGYEEAFCFVQDDLVTVAVKGEIATQETAFIKKLAMMVTGQKESALRILPIA